MPALKKRLTEEQRWQLVLLLRSFADLPLPPEHSGNVEASARELEPAAIKFLYSNERSFWWSPRSRMRVYADAG